MPDPTKITDLEVCTDPQSQMMVYAVDPARNVSMQLSLRRINTFIQGLIPMTDMTATNAKLDQVIAALANLLKPGDSVNVNSQPVPVNVTGTVNVGNFPASQNVSGPAAQAATAGTGFGGVASAQFNLVNTVPITVAALVNTSASKSIAIRIIPVTVGTLTAVTRTRYKAATGIGGTAAATPNLSGGPATPAGKLYQAPTNVPASGGLVERTTLIGPGMPDPPPAEGWLVLKPGEAYVWTAQATGSLLAVAALLATVYVSPEWWEA